MLNESIVGDAALEWFGDLGYASGHGPHMPAAPSPRPSPTGRGIVCGEGKIAGRLREAIRRLNPAKRRTRTRPLQKEYNAYWAAQKS